MLALHMHSEILNNICTRKLLDKSTDTYQRWTIVRLVIQNVKISTKIHLNFLILRVNGIHRQIHTQINTYTNRLFLTLTHEHLQGTISELSVCMITIMHFSDVLSFLSQRAEMASEDDSGHLLDLSTAAATANQTNTHRHFPTPDSAATSVSHPLPQLLPSKSFLPSLSVPIQCLRYDSELETLPFLVKQFSPAALHISLIPSHALTLLPLSSDTNVVFDIAKND